MTIRRVELWKYCNISFRPLSKVWLQLYRLLWNSEVRNDCREVSYVEFDPDPSRNMVSKDRQTFIYLLQQIVIPPPEPIFTKRFVKNTYTEFNKNSRDDLRCSTVHVDRIKSFIFPTKTHTLL